MATSVEVRGRVMGSIEATTVRLLPGAKVEGDITYEMLHIELGAEFEGKYCKSKQKIAPAAALPPPLKPDEGANA